MYVDVRLSPPTPLSTLREQTYNKESFSLAIVATLVSIALLTFLLRLYTRTRLLRFFGIDDWCMLVSMLCALGTLGVNALFTHLDLRQHRKDTTLEEWIAIGPYLWCSALLVIVGVSFVKLSVVFFLLRVVYRSVYRRILYIMSAVVVLAASVWVFSILFHCIPFAAAWNPLLRPHARCLSHTTYRNLEIYNRSINVILDFMFVTFPLPIGWSLRVSFHTQMSLIVVLILGFICCSAAIVRLSTSLSTWKNEEPLDHGAGLFIWSVVEMTTGITAACLPSLKPLFTTLSAFFSNLTRPNANSKPEAGSDSAPPSPYPQSYSTPTFLSLPRPKPTRFHDHTSDLDFDIYSTQARSTRTHSRNPSNFTMFSNFTVQLDAEGTGPERSTKARTCSKGMNDHEQDVKGWGHDMSGYAVSVTSGETCEGSEEAKTIRRMESEESSMNCLEDRGGVGFEAGIGVGVGGIMRTTEVRIS